MQIDWETSYFSLLAQDLLCSTHYYFVDKREHSGPLWKQIDDAFQFVLRNIRLDARLEGIYRKDIYELPRDSIREPIINAVMRRRLQ